VSFKKKLLHAVMTL